MQLSGLFVTEERAGCRSHSDCSMDAEVARVAACPVRAARRSSSLAKRKNCLPAVRAGSGGRLARANTITYRDKLSPQEKKLLRRFAKGKTDEQIAQSLAAARVSLRLSVKAS